MSFQYEHQSQGIFLNDDMHIVQSAYSGVISEQWESLGPDTADVARYVLRMYDRGIVDADKLTRLTSLHFRRRLHILRYG
ncbi:hypothetical protein QE408_001100 [Agrobacterium larrymoorei]|uniref:Uncharacterized protein n=2 Tax=Agrobacterium larrymoorei TaxID=160699 RepID=A0ABU0UGI0_9HYPH|nr:hypothetical protein [Agrobacterium larrymoorei]